MKQEAMTASCDLRPPVPAEKAGRLNGCPCSMDAAIAE